MLNEYKIGDHVFLDATVFLKNNKMNTCHTQCDKGDIVKTKYGPQYICRVTAVRFKGLAVEIVDIDDSKDGHYTVWPEYIDIINDPTLTEVEKYKKILEVLG